MATHTRTHPGRTFPRWIPWAGAVVATVLLIGAIAQIKSMQSAPPVPVVAPVTAPVSPLTARGKVEPARQARIGTIGGGVVASLSVQVGQTVDEQQEIGRIRNPNGAEVLTAPWRGTVTGMPAHDGDTVMPGTVVATVADLSRLQIETTDVDEFLIADIRPSQSVTMTIDALDRQEIRGVVRSVGLQTQTSATGDESYPVVIDIAGTVPSIRPGMSVKVYFIRPN